MASKLAEFSEQFIENNNINHLVNGTNNMTDFVPDFSNSKKALEEQLLNELRKLHEKDFGANQWSLSAKVSLAFVYICIIVVALFGNTVVILVLSKSHRMQTVTNKFLLSLAISDICMASFNMPVMLVFYIKHEWVVGEFMCKFSTYMQGVFIVASIFTLTAIAIDR